jgi:membrane protein YdbS with pleckstrin-like domain
MEKKVVKGIKKLYIKLVIAIVIAVIWFGMAAPALVSAAATELVILGIVGSLLIIIPMFDLGLSIFKTAKGITSPDEESK